MSLEGTPAVSQTVTTDPVDDPDQPPTIDERLDEIERGIGRHDVGVGLLLGLAFVVMIASVIAVGLIQRNGGGSVTPAVAAQNITAELSEFAITLAANEVTPNSTITVTNRGTMAHTIGVRDTDIITASIPPGGTATVDLSGLDAGDYTLWCDIAGHLESGMSAPLTISASAVGSDAVAMGMTAEEHAAMGTDHAAMTPADGMAMDQVMVESMLAFPAETEGRGNQPLVPTILADGTKQYTLTAEIIEWEVGPGTVVEGWAYNGQIPGPRIDVDVGDTVEIEFVNALPLGSDIHWHGIDVPNEMDGVAPYTQDLVASGESFTYRFTTIEPAIGMYHAHAHGDKAIPNGLFGTMYVGAIAPPAGRTISGIQIPADLTIAHDVPMVVNDAGTIGLTLNGKSFPATEPLVVQQGDWVSVTYFNEGLQVHPMHLHGFEQIVYAKDGEPLDQPYAADTILVAPGERYTVLFHADQVGTWVWHCHIINHVESDAGMFGMVTAVIVE